MKKVNYIWRSILTYLCPTKVSKNFANSKLSRESGRTLPAQFLFVAYFDRSIVLVPYPLIQWAQDTDNLRTLAAWLLIKRHHRTGHIHQQSRIKFISHATRVKYFKKLLEIGLIEHAPHIGFRCISLKRAVKDIAGFDGNYKPIILKNSTINDLLIQLRAMILRSSLHRQRYAQLKSPELAGRRSTTKILGRKRSVKLSLSDKGAGRTISMSQSSGRKLKQWMKSKRLVTLINNAPVRIAKCIRQEFWNIVELLPMGYYRWRKGFIERYQSQTIRVSTRFLKDVTPLFPAIR